MATYRLVHRSALAAAGLLLAMGNVGPGLEAADAEANYQKNCRVCHGDEGRGDGPGAAMMKSPPGDFTKCDTTGTRDRDFLIKIISEGGKAVDRSAQMVGFGKRLSAEEIEALADYVAAKCKPD